MRLNLQFCPPNTLSLEFRACVGTLGRDIPAGTLFVIGGTGTATRKNRSPVLGKTFLLIFPGFSPKTVYCSTAVLLIKGLRVQFIGCGETRALGACYSCCLQNLDILTRIHSSNSIASRVFSIYYLVPIYASPSYSRIVHIERLETHAVQANIFWAGWTWPTAVPLWAGV